MLLMIYFLLSYGNLVPRTQWGKIVTMLYAVFGIPVYVLYFLNMGKVVTHKYISLQALHFTILRFWQICSSGFIGRYTTAPPGERGSLSTR